MIYQDDSAPSLVLAHHIRQYLQNNGLTPSLCDVSYEVLALQLIDSNRQANHLQNIAQRDLSPRRLDPADPLFDPIKAIFVLKGGTSKTDSYNEACWLAFLLIYTDDSANNDWAFMRLLYGGADVVERLTWQKINNHPKMVSELLPKLANALAMQQPKPKFGQHRAYESLSQLPIVFASYVSFINDNNGHRQLFNPNYLSAFHPIITSAEPSSDNVDDCNKSDNCNNTVNSVSSDDKSKEDFKRLYTLVRQNLYRFGRLSTFELLCLLGKLGLANIAPDGCYIAEASGPKRGAKLLFGQLNNSQLDEHAKALADYIDVGYQEMEAALCHWQKSPTRYVQHRG